MSWSKVPSFFNIAKPRSFDLKTRYYDPDGPSEKKTTATDQDVSKNNSNLEQKRIIRKEFRNARSRMNIGKAAKISFLRVILIVAGVLSLFYVLWKFEAIFTNF
ncbi:MAG: hypothetical protein IIA45_12755 [Bacteroidetes bacterium]|nr:hypothetical protein [Bacteroidota bacterium]